MFASPLTWPHSIMMDDFSSLQLSAPLLEAVRESGYHRPTPIQAAIIPMILRGRDVRASAQTGTGKTAAFVLPLLQMFAKPRNDIRNSVDALILVPTRELALQVSEALKTFSRYLPHRPKIVAAYGGVSINPQMLTLRGGAHVVVATPGRLLDLTEHNALRLSEISMLVLDEADKLLDLGFAVELTRIFELLPERRQTLLVSATFPTEVRTLAEAVLRDPARIDIETTVSSAPTMAQRAIAVDTARRTQLLRQLIQHEGWTRVLVFAATRHATEHVAEKLRRAGIHAAALHGELSQGARTQALTDFKDAKLQVLVATDIAARGIDVAQLPVVVNYDLPRSTVDYTHRIGRTARAGEHGLAVSFVTAENEAHFRLIEKRHGIRLSREHIEGFEPSITEPATQNTGGIKGKRKSKKDKLREAATREAKR